LPLVFEASGVPLKETTKLSRIAEQFPLADARGASIVANMTTAYSA
jgi:hypothetical protein